MRRSRGAGCPSRLLRCAHASAVEQCRRIDRSSGICAVGRAINCGFACSYSAAAGTRGFACSDSSAARRGDSRRSEKFRVHTRATAHPGRWAENDHGDDLERKFESKGRDVRGTGQWANLVGLGERWLAGERSSGQHQTGIDESVPHADSLESHLLRAPAQIEASIAQAFNPRFERRQSRGELGLVVAPLRCR